eukprot:1908972-Rhodomonas_salina.1
MQENTLMISVQFVPGMCFLVLDFGVYGFESDGLGLRLGPSLPGLGLRAITGISGPGSFVLSLTGTPKAQPETLALPGPQPEPEPPPTPLL